ncbi:MAG: PilZ domain-containing protein [Candidatus Sericytochromatia bacterium]|nr:PilZ domain-containing protein [Candidatus Sericytochromatia bacterium]
MREQITPPLKPDQPVDVVVRDDAGEETTYFSKVTAVQADVFLVTPPILDGLVLPPPRRPQAVTVRLPVDAHVWACEATIESVMGDTWILARPTDSAFVREQRRGNVRATMTLEVQAALHMASRYFQETTLRVLDLSSSGAQIAGDRPFIPNSVLRLRLPLGARTIEVHGKVVRANPFPQGVASRYFTSGFHFTEVAEADREALVRFIFEHLAGDAKADRPG